MTAAGDYRKLAQRYRTLPEQVVRAGAAEMRKAVLEELKRDIGPDLLMSGFTRRQGVRHQKMGVTVTVHAGVSLSEAEVRPGPRRFGGMWTILEYGTKPHEVGELTRKTSGSGGKHMNIGGGEDGWHTGPWMIKRGSPAKSTFANGVYHGTAPAERAMADTWERANG